MTESRESLQRAQASTVETRNGREQHQAESLIYGAQGANPKPSEGTHLSCQQSVSPKWTTPPKWWGHCRITDNLWDKENINLKPAGNFKPETTAHCFNVRNEQHSGLSSPSTSIHLCMHIYLIYLPISIYVSIYLCIFVECVIFFPKIHSDIQSLCW